MSKRLIVFAVLFLSLQTIFAQTESKRKFDPWSQESLDTPYRENISEDEKIAGLSQLWSSVKYNFANFDLVPELNWDSLYVAYLPKVRETKSTSEYYKILMELCARLRDGHTNVYPPKELMDAMFTRPPLRTSLIEDKVIITDVWSPSLMNDGVRPGLEVTHINSIPVKQYAEKNVMPLQSSSTFQDLQVRTYNYALLSGPKSEGIELKLQDGTGKTFDKKISRTGYSDISGIPPSLEFRTLKGNVGYLALNSFSDDRVPKMFDSVYSSLEKTDALILDLRRNGGGADGIALYILGCLTDKKMKTSRWRSPQYVPSLRVWGRNKDWYSEESEDYAVDGKRLYNKPVILLISARTFSAAEDFTVVFDYMKRGTIMGEATGGSTGQPIMFKLPGGGMARICTKRDTYPDGKEFVGTGIQPQITVHPTINDFRQGRDTVLEAALKRLKEEKAMTEKK